MGLARPGGDKGKWIKRVDVTNKRPAWAAAAARQVTSCAANPQVGVRLVREAVQASPSVKGSSMPEDSYDSFDIRASPPFLSSSFCGHVTHRETRRDWGKGDREL